jgi:acylphosphatase
VDGKAVGNDVGYRFIVSGKVQGVFFRASAAREATRLGLRGHAINLPDGRVEVLAIGPATAVEEMRRWLDRGPPAARVDGVHASAAGTTGITGFRTG